MGGHVSCVICGCRGCNGPRESVKLISGSTRTGITVPDTRGIGTLLHCCDASFTNLRLVEDKERISTEENRRTIVLVDGLAIKGMSSITLHQQLDRLLWVWKEEHDE